MDTEHRRAVRTPVALPLTLGPRDSETGQPLGEPVSATMVEMSIYGVRVCLPHIQIGTLHLFYDFNEHPSRHLDLAIFDRERGAGFIIAAHPVWFNRSDALADRPYELGMEFLHAPDDSRILRLEALTRRRPSGMIGWVRELFAGKRSDESL